MLGGLELHYVRGGRGSAPVAPNLPTTRQSVRALSPIARLFVEVTSATNATVYPASVHMPSHDSSTVQITC